MATCTDINALSPNIDNPPCDVLDQAACLCEGCTDDGICFDGTTADDCVCPDCAMDAFCSDPANCQLDGQCNPYTEGCSCADCANHTMCGGTGF
ncbi:MAG TPA: hypothetical protein ENK57_25050 [Polyangiaceae bacterium]|nr:hypothetical protein [Polyangiaceae bacterium]